MKGCLDNYEFIKVRPGVECIMKVEVINKTIIYSIVRSAMVVTIRKSGAADKRREKANKNCAVVIVIRKRSKNMGILITNFFYL